MGFLAFDMCIDLGKRYLSKIGDNEVSAIFIFGVLTILKLRLMIETTVDPYWALQNLKKTLKNDIP